MLQRRQRMFVGRTVLVLWSLYQLYLGFLVRTQSICLWHALNLGCIWGWGLRVHVMRRV